MNFNDLPIEQKQELHDSFIQKANSIGGINSLLTMIEGIKNSKPKALLNKTAIFHYGGGRLLWEKSIFKDTLNALHNAMIKEEKDGDIIAGLQPKEYKTTMNMMRVLKPIKIVISPKDEDCEGFEFFILDTTQEKKTKVSLLFKILFFYNIDFVKSILNYKAKEN